MTLGSGDFIDRLIELKKRHEAGKILIYLDNHHENIVNDDHHDQHHTLSGEFPALTTGQITGQSIVFLLAGFETTSNTLSSLTYHLAKNPEVQVFFFSDTLLTRLC